MGVVNMIWLRTRLGQMFVAVAAFFALLAGAFLRGRRHERAQRDLDDMSNAYDRENMRNEIERDIDRGGSAADRLRSDWRRD